MQRWSIVGCAALAAFSFATSVAAAPGARVSRTELAAMRDAAVGETVLLASAPLDATRVGGVRLKRIDVYARGARVLVAERGGLREVPRSDWLHFIADPNDAEAPLLALSFAPDGSAGSGVIMTPDGSFVVDIAAGDGLELGVGRSTDRAPDGSALTTSCGTDSAAATDALGFPIAQAQPARTVAAPDGAPATRAAVIAVDTDNELLNLKFANNTTNATNYIAALFTQMNLIYERDVDLVLQVGTTILRPSTTPDPFTNTDFPASQAQLVEFGNWWQANQAGTPRVLAMMLSGKATSNNQSAGIAWVLTSGVYCSQRNGTGGGYSFSQVFKFAQQTAPQDTQVVAHELGHNFGVAHTHCTGAAGNFPTGTGTLDQCFTGESGLGCFAGPQVCPGVASARTLMSYCHLTSPGGVACGAVTLAFHPVQITTLLGRIATNVPTCITPVAPGEAPLFANGFE
ncbi:MAG TPA: M12 family metallo-peptidase [Xanthomonadales bacterium]|nr:M12 family metallo-peptidase [Xanthomonadales bacterium]